MIKKYTAAACLVALSAVLCAGAARSAGARLGAAAVAAYAAFPETVSAAASVASSPEGLEPAAAADASAAVPKQRVSLGPYTLILPVSLHAVPKDGGLVFKKDRSGECGGAYVQQFVASPGETLPGTDAFLQWVLPNHTEITGKRRLAGYGGDRYFLDVGQSAPAAAGGGESRWYYAVLMDKKRSGSSTLTALELYFDARSFSAGEAGNIAADAVSF